MECGHEFGASAPQTLDLNGIDFVGYTNTIGNNATPLYFADTGSDVTWTVNASGCSGITADGYTKARAGDTVVIVLNPVTVLVRSVETDGTAIGSTAVYLEAVDPGPFPDHDTVTIVNSGTTATVTHASHGMASGDKVNIRGDHANLVIGVHVITVTGAGTYTYVISFTPGSPSGTITSTFVCLDGVASVGGELSMSRVFPSDQDVTGETRKSSSAPFFKPGSLNGTVDSVDGVTLTGTMVDD